MFDALLLLFLALPRPFEGPWLSFVSSDLFLFFYAPC